MLKVLTAEPRQNSLSMTKMADSVHVTLLSRRLGLDYNLTWFSEEVMHLNLRQPGAVYD